MQLLVVSHGEFAAGILSAAKMIVGNDAEQIDHLELYPSETIEAFEEKLACYIEKTAEKNEGLLIFTDIMSGTPFNTLARMSQKYNFAHIAGVNLPLLVEAAAFKGDYGDAKELKDYLMSIASETFVDAEQVIKKILRDIESQ